MSCMCLYQCHSKFNSLKVIRHVTSTFRSYGLQYNSVFALHILPQCSAQIMSIDSIMPINHFPSSICPFLSLFLSFPALVDYSTSHPLHQVLKIEPLQHCSFHGYSGWFLYDLLVDSCVQGIAHIFCTTVWKHHSFGAQPFFEVQLLHPYRTTEKTMLWLYGLCHKKVDVSAS